MILSIPTAGTNGDALPPGNTWTTSFVGTAGTIDVQSNRLRISTAAAVGSIGRVLSNIPYRDFDLRLRWTPNQAWTNDCLPYIGISDGFQPSGDTAGEYVDGYIFGFYGPLNQPFTSEYLASAGTGSTGSYTPSASTAQLVRFRRQGNSLKAKMWQDGTPEPGGWLVEYTAVNILPDTPLFLSISLAGDSGAAIARRVDIDQFTVDDMQIGRRRRQLLSSVGGGGR